MPLISDLNASYFLAEFSVGLQQFCNIFLNHFFALTSLILYMESFWNPFLLYLLQMTLPPHLGYLAHVPSPLLCCEVGFLSYRVVAPGLSVKV